MDYEPLPLASYCQTGIEVFSPGRDSDGGTYRYPVPYPPAIGRQLFHGLPFLIGPESEDPARCYLGFGRTATMEPVTIALDKTAHYVLMAHAVLETDLWRGGMVGIEVARYRFGYDDGETLDVPIRERFEIGNIPLPWGQLPFLAAPDQTPDIGFPRHTGQWRDIGWRHTETRDYVPRAYYLWVWANPQPEKRLASLTITPTSGQLFVVAGATLSHLNEYPITRSTRRPVKITLLDDEQAKKAFQIEVEVTRGAATRAYPLPDAPLSETQPGIPGFGMALNPGNSPAYTEIAAVPSATVSVRSGDDEIARVNWGELEHSGSLETPTARLELVDSGKNWVRVTVVDAATGQPVPCRVAFLSREGIPYPPHGHHAPVFSNLGSWNNDVGGDLRLGQIAYAYIDGTCEGWLPRGDVLVDIARGYEYQPLRAWVRIEPRQQTLRLELRRWIDMAAGRYFSGDTHVHFLSTQGSHLEAAGEGLQVVNLLQSQWGHLFSNTEEFTGRPSISHNGDTIVYVSQENRQHILGHLSLLGLKKPVMPWGSGGPTEAELGGGLDVTMSHWADQTHAQGGLVVIPHLPTPNGEPAALVATHRADAVEMLEYLDYEHLEYYRYLNAGYRLPLVGGTDKMDMETPVGLYRSYVYIPPDQEFTYDNWLHALRHGHSFVSGGALIWLTVEGQPIGSQIHVKGGGTVEIEAHARSIFPIHALQIVERGAVVEDTTIEHGTHHLSLRTRLKVTRDTWLVARCAGPRYTMHEIHRHHDHRKRGIMAHTSPVYITCGDTYTVGDAAALNYLLTLVDGSLSYIRHVSPQHDPHHTTHHHGLQDHMGHLEAPFHEAAAALHRRMHELGIPH